MLSCSESVQTISSVLCSYAEPAYEQELNRSLTPCSCSLPLLFSWGSPGLMLFMHEIDFYDLLRLAEPLRFSSLQLCTLTAQT